MRSAILTVIRKIGQHDHQLIPMLGRGLPTLGKGNDFAADD